MKLVWRDVGYAIRRNANGKIPGSDKIVMDGVVRVRWFLNFILGQGAR